MGMPMSMSDICPLDAGAAPVAMVGSHVLAQTVSTCETVIAVRVTIP